MMRYLLLVFFLLSSCTVYEKLRVVAEKAEATVTAANEAVVEAKTEWAKHKAAADTDQDGRVSFQEMLIYLLGLGGVGGGTVLVRNAKSNERKARLEARLESVEKRTSTLP